MFKKEKYVAPTPPKRSIGTIIGKGVRFNGILSFDGYAHIDGNVEGEIVSNDTLIVGDHSSIQADIKVGSITVAGRICGSITATRQLVILSTAEVSGRIQTPVLKIEEGAKFNGACTMKLDGEEIKSIPFCKTTPANKTGSQDQAISQKKAA